MDQSTFLGFRVPRQTDMNSKTRHEIRLAVASEIRHRHEWRPPRWEMGGLSRERLRGRIFVLTSVWSAAVTRTRVTDGLTRPLCRIFNFRSYECNRVDNDPGPRPLTDRSGLDDGNMPDVSH